VNSDFYLKMNLIIKCQLLTSAKNYFQGTRRQGSKQLPVFELLSQGKALSENRILPHILRCPFRVGDKNVVSDSENHGVGQSERCWKALLLHTPQSQEPNEWEIVREHFENSRSKKVLSIIQQ
jgi:hypothetical protein